MPTVMNECTAYVDNYDKNKCCARLSSNIHKQCTYKPKKDGLCGIHLKIGKNNIKTVYQNIESCDQTPYNRISKKNIRFTKKYDIKTIIILQAYLRRYIVLSNIYYRTITCYCRHLVSNQTDCTSLENITDISIGEYFGYKDQSNIYWGFNISTFKELLQFNFNNPYNTIAFSDGVKERFNKLLSLYEKNSTVKIPCEVVKDPYVKLQQKCVEIFQIMDGLKQYTQCRWFLDLNLHQLKELYKQVEDIWNYRINLSPQEKCKYVTDGKLFIYNNNYIQKINSKLKLANIILDNFKRLVTEGQTVEDRTTGSLWILSGLTIVSNDARNALPWLFQSANIY
tara:strand:- start:1660 stop:2676 length:1017 start_codon:yes stop_codon:yes gene_type:complete